MISQTVLINKRARAQGAISLGALPIYGNRLSDPAQISLFLTHGELDVPPQLLRQRLVSAIDGGGEFVESCGPRPRIQAALLSGLPTTLETVTGAPIDGCVSS